MTADKVTEVKARLIESKTTVSLSQRSAKMKWRKMRKEHHIYRKEKRAKDEATPSSETGPMEGRHVSWALNASWIKELPQ